MSDPNPTPHSNATLHTGWSEMDGMWICDWCEIALDAPAEHLCRPATPQSPERADGRRKLHDDLVRAEVEEGLYDLIPPRHERADAARVMARTTDDAISQSVIGNREGPRIPTPERLREIADKLDELASEAYTITFIDARAKLKAIAKELRNG